MNQPPRKEEDLPPLQTGRVFCAIFLVLLLATALFRVRDAAELITLPLFHLLFFGGIPAVLLLFTAEGRTLKESRLRALAIGSLYILFLPLIFCGWDAGELASDANAAVGLVVLSVPAHLLWGLLALPYSLCRCKP